MKEQIKTLILEQIEEKGMFQFATPWGVKAILDVAMELEKERKVTLYITHSQQVYSFIAVNYVEHGDIAMETSELIDRLLK